MFIVYITEFPPLFTIFPQKVYNCKLNRALNVCWLRDCTERSISSLAETSSMALSFSREVDFVRWVPVALPTIDVSIVKRAGVELTAPALYEFNLLC